MKNIKKVVATGLVGLSLIAGASAATYASWSATDTAAVGTIRTGNMTVSIDEASRWFLTFAGRPGNTPINKLEDVQLVPGNSVRAWFPVSAELEGRDLVANFTFTLEGHDVEIIPGNYPHLGGGFIVVDGVNTGVEIRFSNWDWRESISEGELNRGYVVDVIFAKGEVLTPEASELQMEVVANLGDIRVTLTQA